MEILEEYVKEAHIKKIKISSFIQEKREIIIKHMILALYKKDITEERVQEYWSRVIKKFKRECTDDKITASFIYEVFMPLINQGFSCRLRLINRTLPGPTLQIK
jgi:hypothetical protein